MQQELEQWERQNLAYARQLCNYSGCRDDSTTNTRRCTSGTGCDNHAHHCCFVQWAAESRDEKLIELSESQESCCLCLICAANQKQKNLSEEAGDSSQRAQTNKRARQVSMLLWPPSIDVNGPVHLHKNARSFCKTDVSIYINIYICVHKQSSTFM